MSTSRRVLVLFGAVHLALFFAIPAEDIAETPYDESEALPFMGTRAASLPAPEPVVEESAFSSAVPEGVAEAPAFRLRARSARPGPRRRPDAQPYDRGAGRAYPISDSLTILDHSLRC